MGKIIYHYNEKTLSYEKLNQALKVEYFDFGFVLASIFTAILIIIIALPTLTLQKKSSQNTNKEPRRSTSIFRERA